MHDAKIEAPNADRVYAANNRQAAQSAEMRLSR
jgi:hypothetical protein